MKKNLVALAVALLIPWLSAHSQDTPADNASAPQVPANSESKFHVSGFEVLSRVNAKDLGLYPDGILSKVRTKWYPEIRRLNSNGELKTGVTIVEFAVEKDGSLSAMRISESSGSDSLDSAASDAINAASPFEPLPGSFHDKELKLRFHFGYAQPSREGAPVCNGPNLGAHAGEMVLRQVGKGVSPPRATYQPDPEYSEEGRRAKYQSIVLVGGTVEAQGSFADLCIAQAAGEGLDEKALEAVRNWKFEPAREQGEPVAVRIGVEVDFRLY